jgi:hypothetical protein
VAYLAALVAAHRITANLLQLDIVDLFIKPVSAAILVGASYVALTQWLPVNDWSLVLRVLAKASYAVLAYYLAGFLVQPQATMERLRYVRRLLRREPAR